MSLILEQQQEITLKEKLHKMAAAIRNNQDIQQCKLYFWEGGNRMCVFGLLGYRAGIPKNELNSNFCGVMKSYGINSTEENFPLIKWHGIEATIWQLWRYNDNGATFDEIADILDETADSL